MHDKEIARSFEGFHSCIGEELPRMYQPIYTYATFTTLGMLSAFRPGNLG